MKYTILFIFFFCFLMMRGYAQKKAPVGPLTGSYILVKQKDLHKLVVVKGCKSKISIDQNKETIRCNVGCNSISGDFVVMNGEIETLQLISTEKVCSAKLMTLERKFMKNMNRVNNYKIAKTMLYLMDADEILIVLKKEVRKKAIRR